METITREHTQEQKEINGKRLIALMFEQHIKITWRVVLLTLLPLVVFVGGGKLLDDQFGTSPWMMIIGVCFAFLTTQLLIVRVFHHLTRIK